MLTLQVSWIQNQRLAAVHLQEIGKLSASVCKAADGGQVSNKSTATEVVPTPYRLEHEATDDFICSIQQSPYIRHALLILPSDTAKMSTVM